MSSDQIHSRLAGRSENRVETHPRPSASAIASLTGQALIRNSGIPLDLNWVQEIRVNTSAVERRAQSQVARRTVKKEWQAAWLLRAITCMDLSTLNSDDTPGRVERLCAKARHPITQEIIDGYGIADLRIVPGAVCLYHPFVPT